jgi:hypothetical protein
MERARSNTQNGADAPLSCDGARLICNVTPLNIPFVG